MSRRKIKKKINFSNKIRDLKNVANHIQAINQTINPPGFDYGKQPSLSGKSGVSIPVGAIGISEEVCDELQAFDNEGLLSNP